MIEKAFADFVGQHLTTLDELMRRYAEYRKEIIESWWGELSKRIMVKTPPGYESVDDRFLKQNHLAEGEHKCGWRRNSGIAGPQTEPTICFAINVTVLDFAARWPFMNGACWTGIQLWLPAEKRDRLLGIARGVPIHTEPVDDYWMLWREWQPLSWASVEGLHEHLTGNQREAEQQDVVNELTQWHEAFENIVAKLV